MIDTTKSQSGPAQPLSAAFRAKLVNILGEKDVVTDDLSMFAYNYDATMLHGTARGVVFPESTQEVVDLVNLCREEGIKLIPRGAGTNLSGGAIPTENSIIIGFARMNRVLEIDTENYYMLVEPGTVNWDLQEILAKYGYYYPPDPASKKASTMGGNISECSGGPKCFRYGVTRDYIYGLEVVLPSGKVVWLGGRDFSSEPFYDLTRIVVGSEGTLGFVTKIGCRILPIPPAKKTILAIYHTPEDASQSVADIVAAGIVPTTLEMMDNLLINTAVEATGADIPLDAGAMLLIEVDGPACDLDEQVETIRQVTKKANVREFSVAKTAAEVDKLWLARNVVIGSVARRRPSYSLQDVTVPRANFPKMVAGIVSASKKHNLPIGTLAHAGDGNLHPLVLFDQRDADEVKRVHDAEEDLVALAIELKGTISGEHGIGLLKKELMPLEFSKETIDVFRRIKRAFDPRNQFNPGKVVDL